ncbi:MAG: hypothetical protein AAB372_00650 [Patescibacteria group bacterium]
MNKKLLINLGLIALVISIASVAGYFIFLKKQASLTSTPLNSSFTITDKPLQVSNQTSTSSLQKNQEITDEKFGCPRSYSYYYETQYPKGKYTIYWDKEEQSICLFDSAVNDFTYYPIFGKGFGLIGLSYDKTKIYYKTGFHEPYGYSEEDLRREAKKEGYGLYEVDLVTGEDKLIVPYPIPDDTISKLRIVEPEDF